MLSRAVVGLAPKKAKNIWGELPSDIQCWKSSQELSKTAIGAIKLVILKVQIWYIFQVLKTDILLGSCQKKCVLANFLTELKYLAFT